MHVKISMAVNLTHVLSCGDGFCRVAECWPELLLGRSAGSRSRLKVFRPACVCVTDFDRW